MESKEETVDNILGLFEKLESQSLAVQPSRCVVVRNRNATCRRCAEACPEGIDLHHPAASAPMGECTKCGECGQACPVHAISFPFLPRRSARGDGEGEEILAEAGER